MDYNLLVQKLVSKGDTVISQAVECSFNESFKILALVEVGTKTQNNQSGHISPDSRDFLILILDGRAPFSENDIEVANFIPIYKDLFSCDIAEIESFVNQNEICVKITQNLTEPQLSFQMARGHRSETFLDQIFRATQIANTSATSHSGRMEFYEKLIFKGSSQTINNDDGFDENYFSAQNDEEEISRDLVQVMGPTIMKEERELIIKGVLHSKQEQFIDLNGFKIFIATWNVNGQSPGSICLLDWLARTPEPPDFYAIAFQELDLSKEAFLFHDSPKEGEWLKAVKAGLHKSAKYKKVCLVRLIGMMLIVFVKKPLYPQLRNVVSEMVGTGLLGKMGNKGGVGLRFDFEETSICFVNCHLAAHVEEYQRRNQDFHQINTRMMFHTNDGIKYIKDHDMIFWFGDMNYRINPTTMNPDTAKLLIKEEKYRQILEYDQLKDQMKNKNVFVGFVEGQIQFRPTYKYDPGTDTWDSSEKNRSPAWCDRILNKGELIHQQDYTSSSQYKLSDHKPVSSSFLVEVKVINQTKYRRVYDDALKQMDKLENEFLPNVTVDIPNTQSLSHSNRNEINFGRIKFYEPVKRTFTIANTGQVQVSLKFIKKLNDSYVCKDWLIIEPISSRISPGEICDVELTMLVEKKSAGQLNAGKDSLYDILVIHLEGGKDIFITVVGEYERSVFGSSLTALMNMVQPISYLTPGKIIELEKGNLPLNHYDIPKELYFLVDYLYREGMETNLFSQSGLQDEIVLIRDWLDTIPNSKIPGSVDSIAEALLLLLDSLPEPVIPFSLHLKCLDSSSNYSSCKQILKLLPTIHRNVFIYLCAFLRELLLHSDKNRLDVKMLANLFGQVMLRDQNHNTKINQRIERQKATFIYQFLVNDDDL